MMKTEPVVFVLHDTYHIMVPVTNTCMMWVKVGENCYYDDSNGIMRSADHIHRMIVPKEALDQAKGYTICEEEVLERKAYFTVTGEIRERYFPFQPVEPGCTRCYHIADTHNRTKEPIKAALNYGKIDFLILNGDVPEDSGCVENFDTIYEIAAGITHGRIPVVYARGNHDLRGVYAEKIGEYTPNEKGNTYYSFRLGDIWGLVLDCGEDKDDSHPEYGHTVCCHRFRQQQTRFIRQIIECAKQEYESEGILHRMVVVHNPFTECMEAPFDIEQDIFHEWVALLRENVKPNLMICGHMHTLEIYEPGGPKDHHGQTWPVVVGAQPGKDSFGGAGFVFREDGVEVIFNDDQGQELGKRFLQSVLKSEF